MSEGVSQRRGRDKQPRRPKRMKKVIDEEIKGHAAKEVSRSGCLRT